MSSESIIAFGLVFMGLSVMAEKPPASLASSDGKAEKVAADTLIDSLEGGDNLLFFESDQASLNRDDLFDLQALGWQLAQNQNQQVCIRGYADLFDPFEASMAISRARAQRVKYVLLKQGVQAQQIDTRAIGNRSPIETRLDERHQRVNRRVAVTWSVPGQRVACE